MQEFETKAVKYNIPTSWEEVTIAHQIEADKLAVEHPFYKGFTERAAYARMPFDVFLHLPFDDFKKVWEMMAFINEPLPAQPVFEFSFNGNKYEVLDTILEAQAQDFISMEIVRESSKNEPSNWIAISKLIAIAAKRLGGFKIGDKIGVNAEREKETLDDYDVIERAKEFEQLPLPIANQLYLFFCLIGNASLDNSLRILESQDQVIHKLINDMKATVKQQAGKGWYGRLRMKIYLKYLESIEAGWINFFTGIKSKG